MKKISIVIPMYNSFHLMERNLQALSKQKDVELEVIIVDDCSTDNSYFCARKYASESALNICILRNEKNGGPGYSRNHGIRYATGDYITFVDSDDYLTDDFSTVIAPLLLKDYDCIIFDYANVNMVGEIISYGKSIAGTGDHPGLLDPGKALVYTYGSTCGKIYRRSLIVDHDVRFGNLLRNDDMPFTKTALAFSKSIYYCDKHLYMYVQRPGSLMHTQSLLDEKNSMIAFALLKEKIQGMGLEEELLALELREVLNNTVLIKIAKKEKRRKIVQYIRENYRREHLKNKYFSAQPKYIRIISYCSYYRLLLFLFFIWKYKCRKREKAI